MKKTYLLVIIMVIIVVCNQKENKESVFDFNDDIIVINEGSAITFVNEEKNTLSIFTTIDGLTATYLDVQQLDKDFVMYFYPDDDRVSITEQENFKNNAEFAMCNVNAITFETDPETNAVCPEETTSLAESVIEDYNSFLKSMNMDLDEIKDYVTKELGILVLQIYVLIIK